MDPLDHSPGDKLGIHLYVDTHISQLEVDRLAGKGATFLVEFSGTSFPVWLVWKAVLSLCLIVVLGD